MNIKTNKFYNTPSELISSHSTRALPFTEIISAKGEYINICNKNPNRKEYVLLRTYSKICELGYIFKLKNRNNDFLKITAYIRTSDSINRNNIQFLLFNNNSKFKIELDFEYIQMVKNSNYKPIKYIKLNGRLENAPCKFELEINISPIELLEIMNSNDFVNEELFENYENNSIKQKYYGILGRAHNLIESYSLNIDDVLKDIKGMSNEEADAFINKITLNL